MRFNQWKEWFLQNQNHFSDIEWNDWRLLSNPERRLIKSSIQQFQRGENSEGKHLFNYAKTMGDDSYTETIRLFIKEEQTHARVLGVYMQKRGIPRITDHWVDNVFRALRKLAGLRVTLTVLLTAEIIAKTYYKALFRATDDQLLREICEQILKDEDKHIEFQCYTLRILFEKRPGWHGIANKWFHEILIRGVRDGAKLATDHGDDGTNDLLIGGVLRTNEMQVWFLSEHLRYVPDRSASQQSAL